MKQLKMAYFEPGMKTHSHTVKGEEVLTGEDGEFTYIRSFGPKPPNQPGEPKSRPVLEDFRTITARVISVHESEVTE